MFKSYKQFILIFFAILLGWFVMSADSAWAATMSVQNTTTGSSAYSNGVYGLSARAEPADTLLFQMVISGAGLSTSTVVVLPSDLTYTGTVPYSTGASSTVDVNGQTITWTYSSASTVVIRFTATIAGGATLSSTHTFSVSFTTNTATPSSASTTINTGPIIKTISVNGGTAATSGTAGNSAIVGLTLTGHFTQASDITAIKLSPGDIDLTDGNLGALTITGPGGDGFFTIAGLHVPALTPAGSYYVVVTTVVSGTTLATDANTTETVAYTVSDGTDPVMSSVDSYVHSTGILTLTFSETVDVSATDLSKITLYDAAAGGTLSQVLTGATVSTTDSTTVTITLTQAQKNAVSVAGVSASNLYVQIAGSGIFDMTANALAAQGSRTAMTDAGANWFKDTLAPITTVSYTQNSVAVTSVVAGNVTITATFSEPVASSTPPQIAIDQPGATDIAATAMTLPSGGDRTIWTYTYTLNADSDGTATVTLSNAPDYANNTLGTVTGNTFTIDTDVPSPAITTLSGAEAGQTALTFSWTPTYSFSDFSTYKFYYRTTAGVTSANGTAITKDTSGYTNLDTASTSSLNLTGLTAATRYYAVIYICDTAANCSTVSNEADAQTGSQAAIIVPPSSGGGGGGGGSSAPSVVSTSQSISTSGGTITTTVGATSATVSIPANTVSGTVNVSEATTTEKQSAPLASSQGVIIGNTIFNLQLSGTASPTFANPVTLEFTYDPAQLNGISPNLLSISYYSATENKWISLPSTVNTTTRKVTAQTTHFTLFAITTVPVVALPTPPATPSEPTTTTPPPTPDTGSVLGSSVGVYPNGSLLKAPNSSAVWYISADQKHLITSAAIFNSHFNWNDIVYLPSSRQLDLYEQGDNVVFAPGTLVKEEGKSAVYRVSATNGKQPILSAEIYLGRGYKWNQVIEVAPNALAVYPEQTYISSTDNFYSADVVKLATTGKIYQIETGSARLVPNVDILQSNKLDKKPIRSISAKEFKQFTPGPDVFYPDGTLVKGSASAVYFISNGKKRAFASGADLDALLYNRKQIKIIADKILAAVESVSPIKLAQKNIHTASAE